MELKRVVVTGIGALTPLGNNVNSLWDSLLAGKSGAAQITKFDTSGFKTKFACEIKNFDPHNHFTLKEIKRMDPYCLYALVAADEAIKDSGLDLNYLNPYRAGVIWSTCDGGWETFQNELLQFTRERGPRFSPFFISKAIPNTGAGIISIKYGLKGVSFSVSSACSSSTNALIEAFNQIRMGRADIVITGGSDASINESHIGGYNSLNALSKRNESPSTASRPFDVDRDGFVIGEAAGALVLEELEHAKSRGANIHSEIAGGASTSDSYHITNPHPDGLGIYHAMKIALEDAGISPSDIDYVNAHATSTPLGDLSESKALEKLFIDCLGKVNISATKSMTGHLLGASGAVETIICIRSIQQGLIPPTINTEEVDPGINKDLDLTIGEKQTKQVNYAMCNTSGFGGHNSTVILKRLYD